MAISLTIALQPSFHLRRMQRGYGTGITSGCGPGLYCPDNPVQRAEMAKFLTTTFGLKLYCRLRARPRRGPDPRGAG